MAVPVFSCHSDIICIAANESRGSLSHYHAQFFQLLSTGRIVEVAKMAHGKQALELLLHSPDVQLTRNGLR